MTTRAKYIIALILVLAVGLGIFYGGYRYGLSKAPTQPIYMPQISAETPQGQHQAAEASKVSLSPTQEKQFADKVKNDGDGKRQPDEIKYTFGADLQQALKDSRIKNKADIQIVTDSDNPNALPPKLLPGQQVKLNVFNEQAFPRTLKEFTIYPSWKGTDIKAADMAILRQTKIFGWKPYLGPAVSWDADRRDKWRVGIRLTDAK